MLLQPTECKTLPKRKLLTKCKQKQRENTTTGCGFRRNNHSKHNACTANANYIANKCPSKPTQNANLPTTGWAFGTQRRKALAWLTHLVCAISLPRGGLQKKARRNALLCVNCLHQQFFLFCFVLFLRNQPFVQHQFVLHYRVQWAGLVVSGSAFRSKVVVVHATQQNATDQV